MTHPADAWVAEDPTLCPTCGRDACEDHLPATATAAPAALSPRLRFAPANVVMTAPRVVEIIEGFAWESTLSVLVSESGGGKTFVLLDAAGAVSTGSRWHGRDVHQGSAAYVSYESDAIGQRLRALHEHTGYDLANLYVLRAHDPLSPRVSREGEEPSLGELTIVTALEALKTELESAGRPPIRLLIIDTVRASLAGSEDSSEAVSAYLRSVRRVLATVPSAAAILAHHAGWQDGENKKRRERGSSAWRGNCDATLYLENEGYDEARGEAQITIRALKVRDIERPMPLRLIRRRVELAEMAGADVRRGPVTSCVIADDSRTREDREAEQEQATLAEHLSIDRRVLRVIVEQPGLTSQEAVRLAAGLNREVVQAALARLMHRGWIEPPARQRQPYIVTPDGQIATTERCPL
jgi:hypothetical protein